jgi:glycosyltransferase involved in cell wall biosynthesis
LIESLISRLSNRVVVLSESNRALFLEKRYCPAHKLVVIGAGSINGVDTTLFSPSDKLRSSGAAFRTANGIPARSYVFGYVGQLSLHKGLLELAEAWRLLRDSQPDVRLMIVSPPEVDGGVKSAFARLKTDPRVHITGFLPDPAIAYAAMDCLILPSHGEGFPIVTLEAGAMELPAIATAVAGCVDAVVHEHTGLLVEPRDAAALCGAMQRVLADPERSRQWGKNARRRCLAQFRQEMVWQGYADLYHQLMSLR